MQRDKLLFTIVLSSVICTSGCKREQYKDPCKDQALPQAEFAFKEILSDTAFFADTIYRDNYVNFIALTDYQSVWWKIGSDPRDFRSADFNLSFINYLGSVNVAFTGTNIPNTKCFPTDKGTYKGSRMLSIVEQFDKSVLTLSPLVGKYLGAFTDKPNDTFTVHIDYFDSIKYDVTITGTQNFYFISNIPKGFRDTTTERARQYPELSYGMIPEMGYKCMQFGIGSNIQQGRGFGNLLRDTLKIYYNHVNTGRQIFIGKRIN